MTDPDLARLRELVGDLDAFARDHWGRRPLVRRADTELPALLDLAAVERLLRGSLRQPAFRLVQEGRTLPPDRSTRPVRLGGRWTPDVADVGAVATALADGATLVLQSLHRTWPPLRALCQALERATSHPCQANAYLTPAGAAGLGRHGDEHDVLVLQLEGRKAWAVDGLGELELTPGHVLYLPARTEHQAHAQTEASLHLTVGILAVTTGAVLRRALARLDPEAHVPLPLGYARAEHADELEATLKAALVRAGDALAGASVGDLAQRERARARGRRGPAPDGLLASVLALDRLTGTSVLRPAVGPDALGARADGRVTLELGRQRLVLPAAMGLALRLLLHGDDVRIGDLPGLTPASQLVLARRLVREGAATVVSEGAG